MDFEQRYIDGEYLRQNPDWSQEDSGWKAEVISALLKKNKVHAQTVAEVGCGAGGILHCLQQQFTDTSFSGYDISPQAITLAQKFSSERLQFFNEDFLQKENTADDLVLVIDVIEHVADFYGFLNRLRAKGKQFIFHIPLDVSCRTVHKPHVLLQQRQSVGHIHFFTRQMVEWALQDTGYQITDWVYTKPVTDIAPADSFKRLVKKTLRNLSFAVNKEWSVKKWGGYSIMALAK
jgi:D-arabinose 1-dehydrogenase-like Zn-dependent alcohol dehydrogenase